MNYFAVPGHAIIDSRRIALRLLAILSRIDWDGCGYDRKLRPIFYRHYGLGKCVIGLVECLGIAVHCLVSTIDWCTFEIMNMFGLTAFPF